MPPLRNPIVADLAPSGPTLTKYDEEHMITYLRMLDADTEGADWPRFLGSCWRVDPDRDAMRARQAYETHLARAKWMTHTGYRLLLRLGAWRS